MRTNAVGRTMDGLVGVGGIVGVEGCRINEGRHWARQDLAGSRKARPARGVAAHMLVILRHFLNCQHTESTANSINAPGLKHRPMSAPTRGRAQNIRGICGNLKQKKMCEDLDKSSEKKSPWRAAPLPPKNRQNIIITMIILDSLLRVQGTNNCP